MKFNESIKCVDRRLCPNVFLQGERKKSKELLALQESGAILAKGRSFKPCKTHQDTGVKTDYSRVLGTGGAMAEGL